MKTQRVIPRILIFLIVICGQYHKHGDYFAEAACSSNLGTKTPVAGETVRILAGQCAGIISLTQSNIAVFFEPGSGIQEGKYIKLPTSGSLTNITIDVRGVTWSLSRGLFYSGLSSDSLKLVASSFWFSDSTFAGGAAPDTIGLLTKHVSSGRYGAGTTYGPSLVGSEFTINKCILSGPRFALTFPGTLTDSIVNINKGSHISAGTGGVSPEPHTIYLPRSIASSTLTISDSTVTVKAYLHGMALHASGDLTDSALTIRGCSLGATFGQGDFALWAIHSVSLTRSTMLVEDSTVTVVSAGWARGINSVTLVSSTFTLRRSAVTVSTSSSNREISALVIRGESASSILIEDSVLKATRSSGSPIAISLRLRASSDNIGYVALRSSKFTGKYERAGPLESAALEAVAIGILCLSDTYWNSQVTRLDRMMLLPTYTSPNLVINCFTRSPTLTETPAPTKTQTRSKTTTMSFLTRTPSLLSSTASTSLMNESTATVSRSREKPETGSLTPTVLLSPTLTPVLEPGSSSDHSRRSSSSAIFATDANVNRSKTKSLSSFEAIGDGEAPLNSAAARIVARVTGGGGDSSRHRRDWCWIQRGWNRRLTHRRQPSHQGGLGGQRDTVLI